MEHSQAAAMRMLRSVSEAVEYYAPSALKISCFFSLRSKNSTRAYTRSLWLSKLSWVVPSITFDVLLANQMRSGVGAGL